jgi:hypothetical protein
MLAFFLSRVIKDGTLEIIWPNGRRRVAAVPRTLPSG